MTGDERGCGQRIQGGLYISVGFSSLGLPFENFYVDPAVQWEGPRTLRAPMLLEDKEGTKHLVLGIGKEYYPFFSDYAEESRRMGISKRIPYGYDFSELTPRKSKLLLMHPKAIPYFTYKVMPDCPKEKEGAHVCIGDLWPLSSADSVKEKHEVAFDEKANAYAVKTPSVAYWVNAPVSIQKGARDYLPGIVMAFPYFHLEFVSRGGNVPDELKKKIERAGFVLKVVDK